MSRTVARLLAESLEAHDVDQIYCVPGESYVGLTSELLQRNSMRVVVCRHETGAGYMAVADGRLRSRAGVAMVSRGPGMANAMGPLHTAFHDATPMVILVGQVERKDFGRLALQEQNYSRLLADTTKLVIEVNEPEQASEAIARAFHVAESGTQGPVAVILPEDIFDEETDAEIDAARDRPIAGPRLADLNRLAEEWVLPINPTHRRPHLFDAQHPNYGGYMGIRVPPALIGEMKKADLMVALGERMTDSVSQSYTFPAAPSPQLPFIHIWPDANEVGRVWRPTLGLPCSPHEVIKALLARGAPPDAAKRRGWVDGLNAIHRQLLAKEWNPTSDGINFAAIVCEIDKHLAPDAVVTTDAGNFGSFVHRYIGFKQSQIFLSSVVGAMGSGMPMAVGAALRQPGRQVVCFIGDGGTLMMGNELATAIQYGGAPIMVVSDNSMYGTIGMHSYVRYPERAFFEGTRLTNPDFAAWGRSFGAEGITIGDESEIADGIAAAFAVKTKPVVVHCLTSAVQMSAWRRFAGSETTLP
jgi:acetolactate synthase I/II/III large subunit